jgi:AMP nucleosidase
MPYQPAFIAPARFTDATAALAQARLIYDQQIAHLRDALQRFVAGENFRQAVRAKYPFVRIHTDTVVRRAKHNSRLSYGFVAGPGTYETTLTRPDLSTDYYRTSSSPCCCRTTAFRSKSALGTDPIPIHFSAWANTSTSKAACSPERRLLLRDQFDLPDLALPWTTALPTAPTSDGAGRPPDRLALFTAPRVDYSLHRLRHYTGTAPEHFQNFVLFTNYQFYIDEFVRMGHALKCATHPTRPTRAMTMTASPLWSPATWSPAASGWTRSAGDEFGAQPPRLPQMPAYHLMRADRSGITMVNIGVGPANAKTITDHIAVLRPHAWLMLGHCAGLRNTQQLGDYVLAHAYVREDHVLDEELPLWVPIPALAEIQVALEQAVADVTQVNGAEMKGIMRTGTVASTDNRNWELLPHNTPQRRFSQSRAVALDMESATIAANGFRFRVPYGTLLCVSDKPLHGEIKLPGMANHFYRERVDQHLRIGMRAVEILRTQGPERLHSRKLRSFNEVAFQ